MTPSTAIVTGAGQGSGPARTSARAAVLAVEEPDLRVYAFDPGDMRTHISDRPTPATVVPALLRLLDDRLPSGRQRAADLATAGAR